MFYFTLSGLVAIFAIAAVFVAKKAMERGLTYSAMSATVWTLSFIAVSRIWHTLREILNLGTQTNELLEIVEYVILLVAFAVFIVLARRAGSTKIS